MARNQESEIVQRWRTTPVKRMLGVGDPLEGGDHQNPVWRGMAQYAGSTEPAQPMIVKWIEDRSHLAAELASALTAQALGLPVPEGYLVIADVGDLPGIPRRAVESGAARLLCFGSQLMWPDDSIGRPTQAAAVEEWVWQHVCDSPTGAPGGVWDELLANDDRHCDNVESSGGQWWLVDHEYALPSLASVMQQFASAMVRQGLIDYCARDNTLAREMLHRRRNDHGMQALPGEWQRKMRRLDLVIHASEVWQPTGISEVDTTLDFTRHYLHGMRLRMPALRLHLNQRLQVPGSETLWSSLPSPTPPP